MAEWSLDITSNGDGTVTLPLAQLNKVLRDFTEARRQLDALRNPPKVYQWRPEDAAGPRAVPASGTDGQPAAPSQEPT